MSFSEFVMCRLEIPDCDGYMNSAELVKVIKSLTYNGQVDFDIPRLGKSEVNPASVNSSVTLDDVFYGENGWTRAEPKVSPISKN